MSADVGHHLALGNATTIEPLALVLADHLAVINNGLTRSDPAPAELLAEASEASLRIMQGM